MYTHYPKVNGIYRLEAKAVDGGSGTTLEDTTPVSRRYRRRESARAASSIGARREHRVHDAVPGRRRPEDVFDEANLAKLGPGTLKIDWFNSTRLRVILPPAERSNLCKTWRTRAARGGE